MPAETVSIDERRERVLELRGQGLSFRRIAAALEMSESTVRRDLSATGSEPTRRVLGKDGKLHPARLRASVKAGTRRKQSAGAPLASEASGQPGSRDPEREQLADLEQAYAETKQTREELLAAGDGEGAARLALTLSQLGVKLTNLRMFVSARDLSRG